jgi:hypothetical protein
MAAGSPLTVNCTAPQKHFPLYVAMLSSFFIGCISKIPFLAVALEILHRALVLLRCGARLERPEVATPASLRILLARVQTVLS